MQLQAEIYNQSIEQVAEIISAWKNDADNYLLKIEETQRQGKPVAGMEVYHQKQVDKINAIERFAFTAHNYISALESEVQKARVSQITNNISTVYSERTRICDLPAGSANDHLETLELLNEILYRLPNPKNIY